MHVIERRLHTRMVLTLQVDDERIASGSLDCTRCVYPSRRAPHRKEPTSSGVTSPETGPFVILLIF
jgi:hypothetical protein